ncbi:hypothetical protein NUH30_01555 [Leptospira sp. 85282-16]|uniref:hypothetical protein n=1 Tax=Leptospira sp. 85282-16 TaxID=2971256 RepID=UPI0021C118F1|nr:hypothetical protein [Leptospira sp. 85282-16]MCT8332346.1 hypothetical protein [Leptospira sp. 85282-16]
MIKLRFIFLIIAVNISCNGLYKILNKDDKDNKKYLGFVLAEFLPITAGCPPVNFTIEKDTNYPITLSTESPVIFNISSTNNLPPPNQYKEYVLIVSKDSTTNLDFFTNRLCYNRNSEIVKESPITSTPTELQFRLSMNDVRTLQNAFYLKLVSGKATVTIRQE